MKLEVNEYKLELVKPYILSNVKLTHFDTIVLRLSNGEFEGFGEVTSLKHYCDETSDSVKKVFADFEKNFVLEDIEQVLLDEKVGRFARSALECALLDYKSRKEKVDFTKIIGSVKKDSFKLVGNIGIFSISKTLGEAEDFVKKGFETLKIKIGQDVEEDVEKIKNVADQFPQVNIRVDANQGYNLAQTRQFIKSVVGLNIELIEQPMPCKNLEKHAQVKKESHIPIMLDEDVYSIRDVEKIIDLDAADKVKSKLFKTGVRQSMQISQLLSEHDMDFVWGNGVESHIGAFTELKVASVMPNVNNTLETIGPLKLKENITNKKFDVRGGQINVDESIGLGFSVTKF
jgi:L-alanine-DL-glutamate epimerase-like enolase superfamily enzyme